MEVSDVPTAACMYTHSPCSVVSDTGSTEEEGGR